MLALSAASKAHLHAIRFGGIGTLVETSELQRKAFNRAFEEAGLGWYWQRDAYRSLLSVAGGRNRIRYFGRQTGSIDEQMVISLHARKTELFQQALLRSEIAPRAGVKNLINKALNTDTRLAIASTTSKSNIVALAAASGIDLAEFDVIVHGDLVTNRKPDPEVYEKCLGLLGTMAHEAAAIEDSDSGVHSALGAGLACFALPGANTDGQNFDQAALVTHSLETIDVIDTARSGRFAPRIGSLDRDYCERLVAGIR